MKGAVWIGSATLYLDDRPPSRLQQLARWFRRRVLRRKSLELRTLGFEVGDTIDISVDGKRIRIERIEMHG